MANIRKRSGKNGPTYLIRVFDGYDADGNQVVHSLTWKPEPGMSEKAMEKEANRQAVLFEERCAAGGVSGAVKFEPFARQWFAEYAEESLRSTTVFRLHQLEERTYKALGHLRLDKLTTRHIQLFINNLGEEGVNQQGGKALPKDIKAQISALGLTQKVFAQRAGLSCSTVSAVCRGVSITPATAEKIAAALGKKVSSLFTIQEGKSALSPKTIRNYHSFLSSVLGYAVKMGMLQTNPAANVTLPPLQHKEKECYTIEEAQHFLESLETAPMKYRIFCVLAIFGGFRREELLGLEWSDLDFDHCVVTIRRTSLYTKSRGVFTDTTKTLKSQRSLRLPESVFTLLRQYRSAQAQEQLLAGDRWIASDRLITGDDGRPMHPNTPYHWLMNFCQRTGQRFLGIHTLRHLNATLLITSGADIRTVSAALGHSQTSTTLNIYAHTFAEAQARASSAIADILSGTVTA